MRSSQVKDSSYPSDDEFVQGNPEGSPLKQSIDQIATMTRTSNKFIRTVERPRDTLVLKKTLRDFNRSKYLRRPTSALMSKFNQKHVTKGGSVQADMQNRRQERVYKPVENTFNRHHLSKAFQQVRHEVSSPSTGKLC
jgi:hypothetical protein